MEEDLVFNDVLKIERAGEAERREIEKKEQKKIEIKNRDPLDFLAELGDDE
jgi:hypothetical protein